MSAADNALTLARWDGVRWSETRHLPLGFADPESGEPLDLGELRLAFVPPARGQEETGEMLAVTGTAQNGRHLGHGH
ncbi:MAG: hypothetical protein GWN58_27980 [Anaerolineae bacterium]|nr:hypothetical protein [Anaerolineae bacterium]